MTITKSHEEIIARATALKERLDARRAGREDFTIRETAQMLGVGRYTIDKAIREGRLGHYRPNDRDIRITQSHIDAFRAIAHDGAA
ncbi:excisionase family DNA binding protein [Leucobacter exalbidus]|uniref:Excisionase family DNA binding protein n=1 Tax=Leucobacter exalbidus TaxID=662960 RepID=A0A940T2Z6_9MICO|nr:helix-turn-helix domain-containing protein [Leucobacter exalbidus]MBP1325308.1 excisionase family DNA binding protein [Leucobacter exalbidus]